MLIKYEQDGQAYAQASGRVYSLKHRETQSGKAMATFSIAYGTEKAEFGDQVQNKHINCIAFAYLAEYIKSLDDSKHKINLLVCGKLQTSEYQGNTREEILCDFVIGQPIADATVKRIEQERKKEDDDFDDLNI